ncbi:MAG TPA: SH3 domain-containing protein [Spirochaetia bacterium]
MKKRWAALVAGLLLCSAGLAAADAQMMSVTVKETQVRATPSYMGKILGVLTYGARVTVLDQAGAPKGWVKIVGPDGKLQGWVNISSLTTKEIALKSGTGAVSQTASSGDVALAGKGFNSDVEAKYKADQKLDYTWVDRMESWQFTPQAVSAFLVAGGLTEPGGAQ